MSIFNSFFPSLDGQTIW